MEKQNEKIALMIDKLEESRVAISMEHGIFNNVFENEEEFTSYCSDILSLKLRRKSLLDQTELYLKQTLSKIEVVQRAFHNKETELFFAHEDVDNSEFRVFFPQKASMEEFEYFLVGDIDKIRDEVYYSDFCF